MEKREKLNTSQICCCLPFFTEDKQLNKHCFKNGARNLLIKVSQFLALSSFSNNMNQSVNQCKQNFSSSDGYNSFSHLVLLSADKHKILKMPVTIETPSRIEFPLLLLLVELNQS